MARYFLWLGDVLQGDFGISARTQQPVDRRSHQPRPADPQAGRRGADPVDPHRHRVGIVTALKQYSGFDYITTFFTFVFFSLPVFWVAVILKGMGGINFNDWLRDGAHFAPWFIVLCGVLAAGLATPSPGAGLGGAWRSPPSPASPWAGS